MVAAARTDVYERSRPLGVVIQDIVDGEWVALKVIDWNTGEGMLSQIPSK